MSGRPDLDEETADPSKHLPAPTPLIKADEEEVSIAAETPFSAFVIALSDRDKSRNSANFAFDVALSVVIEDH